MKSEINASWNVNMLIRDNSGVRASDSDRSRHSLGVLNKCNMDILSILKKSAAIIRDIIISGRYMRVEWL